MRDILSTFAHVFGVLTTLIFFAGPLQADPVVLSPGSNPPTVTFTDGGANPINIVVCSPFVVGTIRSDGTFSAAFKNETSTILDFHFESTFEGQPWVGEGGEFFGDFTSSNEGIDFVIGGTGTGIPPGNAFTIRFRNFTPGTIIRGHATVPEPTTILLLGTGLAGVAIKTRERLKNRKSKRG